MKAPKAKSGKDSVHTVTFRITAAQRQKLRDYTLSLIAKEHRRVSDNGAVQHMIDSLKAPAKAKDPVVPGQKGPELEAVTFRITEAHREKLNDYAIALIALWRRRVSNTEAVRHMIDSLKPAPKARAAQASASAQE